MDAIVQFPETAPEFQFDLDPGLISEGTDNALGLGSEIVVDTGQEDLRGWCRWPGPRAPGAGHR